MVRRAGAKIFLAMIRFIDDSPRLRLSSTQGD
jgi:hypothetical protein